MRTIKISSLMLLLLSLVFASCGDDEENEAVSSDNTEQIEEVHDYVDLGLPSGVKWATCNVGASCPEDYGDYFAWGEIQPKSSYDEENSKTYGKKIDDISGDSLYDAACYNWGGKWRMPTEEETNELFGKDCIIINSTQNGVYGILVISRINDNSIFLPASGRRDGTSLYNVGKSGYLWSSTPFWDSRNLQAYCFIFSGDCSYSNSRDSRYSGFTVRPVQD